MAPVCVANALCECVNGMGGAAAAGVTVGGVTVAGSTVAGVAVGPAPMCAPPPAGALVLNEVMANPQGEDSGQEYVELVNLSDTEVDLSNISVLYAKTQADLAVKATFAQGCMAPRSAVALYDSNDPARHVWSSPPRGVAFSKAPSFSFTNSADAYFELRDGGGAQLSSLSFPSTLIKDGESVTLSPEIVGMPTRHKDASGNGSPLSPSRCANGGSFENNCADGEQGGTMMVAGTTPPMGNTTPPVGGSMMPAGTMTMGGTTPPMGNTTPPPPACPAPSSGQLLVNEVHANPTGNETQTKDEFVEVLNLGGAANLQGITLSYNGAVKITFPAGCMEGRSALALFNQADGAQWRWSTPTADSAALAAGHAKFTITNTNPATLTLKDAAGAVLDELTVPTNRIADGVSANRSPDAMAGGAVELHTTLSPSLNISPALCPSGGRYEAGCAP